MGKTYSVRTESQRENYHHHHYYFINLRGLNHVGSKVDNSVAREMAAKGVTAPCFLRRWCPWVSYDSHTIPRGEGQATWDWQWPVLTSRSESTRKSWEGHVLSHRKLQYKASTGVVTNLLHVLPVVFWIVELFSVVFVTLRTRAFLIGNQMRRVRCQTAVVEQLC